MAARGDRALRDVAAITMGSSKDRETARDIATGSTSPRAAAPPPPPPPPLDSVSGLEEGERIDTQEEEEVVAVPWLVWCLRRTPWLRQLVGTLKIAFFANLFPMQSSSFLNGTFKIGFGPKVLPTI